MAFTPVLPPNISHFHEDCRSVADDIAALHTQLGSLEKRYEWFGGKSYYDPSNDCYYTAFEINCKIKELINKVDMYTNNYRYPRKLEYLGYSSFEFFARGYEHLRLSDEDIYNDIETQACRVHTVHSAKALVVEAMSRSRLKELTEKLASNEEFYEEQGWAPLAWWVSFLNVVAEFFSYCDVSAQYLNEVVDDLTGRVDLRHRSVREGIEKCCMQVKTRGPDYTEHRCPVDSDNRPYHYINGNEKSAQLLAEALGRLEFRFSDLLFAPGYDSPYLEALQRKFDMSNYEIKYRSEDVDYAQADVCTTIVSLHWDLRATLIGAYFDEIVRESEKDSSYRYESSFRLLKKRLDLLESKMATLKESVKAAFAKEREGCQGGAHSGAYTGAGSWQRSYYSAPPEDRPGPQSRPQPQRQTGPVNIFGASYPVPVFTRSAGDYLEGRDRDLHLRFRTLSTIPKTNKKDNKTLRARITLGVNDANGAGLTKRRVVVAYRKLALKWHPDKASGRTEEIKELHTQVSAVVNHAKDVLLREL